MKWRGREIRLFEKIAQSNLLYGSTLEFNPFKNFSAGISSIRLLKLMRGKIKYSLEDQVPELPKLA